MQHLWRFVVLALCLSIASGSRHVRETDYDNVQSGEETGYEDDYGEPCQCGVFMTQQLGLKARRGKPRGPPNGEPVVTYDTESSSLPCGQIGFKHCVSKCLDVILKYLPKAGPVICGAVERDVQNEKAFLFVKNCEDEWKPTNFSAGKEFCCTDGQHHKC